MDIVKDFAKLTERLRNERIIEIPIHSLNTEEESFSHGMITKALSFLGHIELEGTVHLIVSELLTNAERAVLKRDLADDPLSMETEPYLKKFRKEYESEGKALRVRLRRAKPSILFRASMDAGSLTVTIANKGIPTIEEHERIEQRMDVRAKGVFTSDLNDPRLPTPEGEGLGLCLIGLAMAHAGMAPSCLQYSVEGDKTLFTLTVKPSPLTVERLKEIESSVLDEVEALPAFPENIRRMMEVCESPKSDVRQVASEIGRDPGVASQIIKLANSGGFAGGNVSDLNEAVKIIGITNVSGVLMRVGAYGILEKRYGQTEALLEHPVRVGFYARTLARKYKISASADQAYVAGLLHDIGKAVLFSRMKSADVEGRFFAKRDTRSHTNIEELAVGANHAVIGALLGRKWKFPENLCHAIEFHHAPSAAPAESQRLVNLVYFANAIADAEEGKLDYYAVDPEVLSFFNITTADSFQLVAGTISAEFPGPG
ncbi:MAG: HDOD domain-containing protein [Spirochaetia bacterium]|nr:HDOD domain-containing protein [Spirochaetia bacterium]